MSGAGLFEFLFKYRPVVFEHGDFTFVTTPGSLLVSLLVLALALLSLLAIRGLRDRISTRDRAVLASLRVAAFLLLFFCTLRPALIVPTAVPQENVLGVLLDDSLSMRLEDQNGLARSAVASNLFDGEEGRLVEALEERFKLRYFAFSSGTARVGGPQDLSYTGQRTDLGQALERVRQDLAAVPLSGLVVVTDGADNSDSELTESLLGLRARSIPVYVVGVGTDRFERDVEVERVEAPRSVLQGSSVSVDLIVSQRGYGGAAAELVIEESGRILKTESITLPGVGQTAPVRVHFTATEPGAHTYRFEIRPLPGERISENNARELLVTVEDDRRKILYFEGEPRFELKFIKRAIEDDENLHVVALERTAQDKFLRLDIDDPEELIGGFPRTREELYAYQGLILGSVEASFFTHDQLQMIEDFVSRRGGGLLTLGGRRSFAEGGFAGTPVADVLPVVLEGAPSEGSELEAVEYRVVPTPAGRGHPALQLLEGEDANRERWETLPPLTSVNHLTGTKPGAVTLLQGIPRNGPDRNVVLAYQRYGRGVSIALGVQDTWIWQMHADIPLEDQSHEVFWRQMLRWLVSGAPGQVSIQTMPERPAPGEAVTLVAEVDDERYVRLNGTDVVAYVTDPQGEMRAVPMDWSVEEDGEYRGEFVPPLHGRYEINVEALQDGIPIGHKTTWLDATDREDEYFGAETKTAALRRIADETGGRYYTPETASGLPEEVQYSESGSTVLEEQDLWDMPIILILLFLFLSSEWFYRRYRGLR